MVRKKDPAANANVTSVDKAFSIIDYLHSCGGEASVGEISRDTGMNKSSVYRILNAVKATGYIYQNEQTANYGLSARFYQIGIRIQNSRYFLRAYAPHARQLNEKYNEVVTVAARELSTYDVPRYLELYGFRSSHSLTMRFTAGEYTQSHCTASGKCLLAFSEESYLSRFEGCPLTQHTSYTITGWPQLKIELQRIREKGYALDNEEYELGLMGIATPIFSSDRDIVGALSLTLPVERFRMLDLAQVIADMRAISELKLDV